MTSPSPTALGWSRLASPLGDLFTVDDGQALRILSFAERWPAARSAFEAEWGTLPDTPRRPCPWADRLDAYFAGRLEALDTIPVAPDGTEFQRRVWGALREVRAGRTVSYGELARRLGDAGGVRAVGAANGANPIAVVIPCHRVIGADGSLVGYGGGLERKRWLLAHEGALLL